MGGKKGQFIEGKKRKTWQKSTDNGELRCKEYRKTRGSEAPLIRLKESNKPTRGGVMRCGQVWSGSVSASASVFFPLYPATIFCFFFGPRQTQTTSKAWPYAFFFFSITLLVLLFFCLLLFQLVFH